MMMKALEKKQPLEIFRLLANLKNNLWLIGVLFLGLGIADRVFSTFADGYLSGIEFTHLSIICFFCMSWLCLKPEIILTGENDAIFENHEEALQHFSPDEDHLNVVQSRMIELEDQHLISQAYTLPFPYLCQIYHLLNLKHLESIHSFSLNNLRVTGVLDCQPTLTGGVIKFKTMLSAPVNILRLWRQSGVEVELTLHTPFTIELSIPLYNDKKIIVIFNVVPLSKNQHKLFIDIYSNLTWYKPILQIILHAASCLTLFEDLPYLQTLAKRNLERLVCLNSVLSHETQWLFKRFIDLYGANLQLLGAAI
ncbi:hypothetical protein [Gloeothece verrucosa]|nr:hypothetical protein [Gloeothece verrucosa]